MEIGFSRHVVKKLFDMKEEIEIRYAEDGSVLIEVSIFDCDDKEIVEEAEEVRKITGSISIA